MSMKLDKIFMNPPYKGNLHLNILKECQKHSDNIVNLSPILWLEFPTQTDSIYGIDYIEPVYAEKARELFKARNQTDLGIYVLKPNTKSSKDFNSFKLRGFNNYNELYSIWNKVQALKPSSIKDVITPRSKSLEKYSIIFSHMSGLNKNHDFVYTNGLGSNGKTYKENVKNQHKNDTSHHIEFNSLEEAENFRLSLHTNFMKFIVLIGQPGLLYVLDTIPFMKDYTHKWTDEDFYDYFKLTSHEISIINTTKRDINITSTLCNIYLSEKIKNEISQEFNVWKDSQYAGKNKDWQQKMGAFYTPPELSIQMVEKFDNLDGTILDPTCGCGGLLAACILAGADPNKCYGIELDPDILDLCRERLGKLGVPKYNLHLGNALNEDCYDNFTEDYEYNPETNQVKIKGKKVFSFGNIHK